MVTELQADIENPRSSGLELDIEWADVANLDVLIDNLRAVDFEPVGISILEETPPEKEPFVELYYYDMVAFTTLPPISLLYQSVPSS